MRCAGILTALYYVRMLSRYFRSLATVYRLRMRMIWITCPRRADTRTVRATCRQYMYTQVKIAISTCSCQNTLIIGIGNFPTKVPQLADNRLDRGDERWFERCFSGRLYRVWLYRLWWWDGEKEMRHMFSSTRKAQKLFYWSRIHFNNFGTIYGGVIQLYR